MKYLLLVISLFAACSPSGDKLIDGGKSDYKIFVADSAAPPEQYAAKELQKYLEKVSGCL